MNFNPRYTISNKLLRNITDISKLVVDLNNKRFPKPILYQLDLEARQLSTYSSTSIEGNNLNITQIKKVLKKKPKNLKDTEQEVINYNEALEYLNRGIKDKDITLDHQLILKTHKLVTKNLLDSSKSGKYRYDIVIVNNPLTKEIVYIPPDYKDIKKLMTELLTFIKKNKKEIDPLILAGIFHKQFVLIHPFFDGNGRTCRLLTKVLLAELGLDTFELFSFENFYNQNVTKYFSLVGERGDYTDHKDIDFTEWLEYFTEGILQEILRVREILQNKELTPKYTILKDQGKVLEYIRMNGYITDRKYAELTDRAKATRVIDFNKLRDLGLIERRGKGRGTYYTTKQ
jgi:Fic family protein